MNMLSFNEFVSESFGGNSGYIGYSISVRAAKAKDNGRFPKTEFKSNYGISDSVLNLLITLGYVTNNEWHHTSKFGNKTPFYSFLDDACRYCWEDKSNEIKALFRKNNILGVQQLFEDYIESYNEKMERERKELDDSLKEYNKYVEQYRKEHDKFDSVKPFVASNGCTVTEDGNTVIAKDGTVLSKRHGRNLRDSARSEYAACKNKWREGLLTYNEYLKNKQNQ